MNVSSKLFVFPILGALVAATHALPASADPPSKQPSEMAKKLAREHLEKGEKLYAQAATKKKSELFEAAYLEFQTAYAMNPDDGTLWNLALSEIPTGRHLDAMCHLRLFAREHPEVKEPQNPRAKGFEELWSFAFKRTGHVDIEAPARAPLFLDGKVAIGVAPLADVIDVDPGAHSIEARLPSETPSVTVDAGAGVVVKARIGATAEGPNVASVAAAGGGVAAEDPLLPTTREAPPEVATSGEHVSTAGTVVRWTLTGVAVAGIAMGAGFVAVAGGKHNDGIAVRDANPGAICTLGSPACDEYRSDARSERSAKTVSTLFYTVGISSAVLAAGAWLFWPKEKALPQGAWIAPEVSPVGAGARAGFVF